MKLRKKRLKIAVLLVVAILITLYVLLVNFLVSAALVPSFMRRLDSFSRVTEESLAAQVHTSDVESNHQKILDATADWLEAHPGEKRTVTTPDGYRLVAQEFESDTATHHWALLLHGYTGWKEEMYPYAMWYQTHGFHCLVPDLRCQGESEGDFIGMGYTDSRDCLLWLNLILETDPEAKITVHGQSMGAATALMLSALPDAESHIAAVISDCSYTDARSMFGDKAKEWFHLPAFPLVDSARLALLARGGYDLYDASAVDAVRKNQTIPTLFIHGEDDALIDVSHAYALYDAASCEKKLLIVSGAGHAQALDKEPDLYWETVAEWIEPTLR